MKYILTTNLISTNNKFYYLGKWAVKEEYFFSNKKIFDFIWDDKKVFLQDSYYIRSLCLRILNNIYRYLNKAHNVKYSKKFWKQILFLWLYHYVSSLYFRWRTVSEVDKEYTFIIAKNIHQNILLPEDNTQSFIKKIQDEFWNQKLIDDIIITLNKKYIYKKINKKYVKENNYSKLLNSLIVFIFPTILFNFINYLIKLLPKKKIQLIDTCYNKYFFIKFFPKFFYDFINEKLISKINNFLIKYSKEDITARYRFSKFFEKNKFLTTEFEKFLTKRIIEEIPKSFLENFKNFTNRFIQTRRSKIIITSYGLYDDNCNKFDIALKQDNKSAIYLLEHGGSFPYLKDYLDLDKIYLKKISWFKHGKEKNVVQCKLNPIFFKYNNNYLNYSKYKNNNLLIIGGGHPKWVYGCPYGTQATQRLEQVVFLKNFVKELKNGIKEKLFLKPHHFFNKKHGGIDYNKLYANIISKEKLVNNKLHMLFNSTKIIVCTYPETTFSESMATGIPTVLVFNKSRFFFHKDSEEILNDLINCKIVFTNPKIAAKHINSIWDDPLNWFHSVKVKKVRDTFLNLALNKDVSMSNIKNKYLNIF